MQNTPLKISTVLSLGIAVLLLASCSSAGSSVVLSEPESQITQGPAASEGDALAAGDYIPYESFAASGDQYSDSKVVLFFNAVWCSTCKQARDNFESSLEQIPEDLTIVVVDFDNSIELRKKYGVSVQHTFIEIDNTGEAVGKWSGSVTVAEIVGQLS